MKNLKAIHVFTLAALVGFGSCQKDENDVTTPSAINEAELITTLKVSLFDGNNTNTFKFKDADGEGGQSGVTDTIFLDSNKVYIGTLQFLDESNPSHVEDITEEVKKEKNDHLVCYSANTNGLSITVTDKDGNNHPLGLETDWSTTSAANGTLTVRLRHQPGIKTGDCDLGETDIEVVFPVRIK